MKQKFLFVSIILIVSVLVLLYTVKLLFPSVVLELAQSERITAIGKYVDSHIIVKVLLSTAISFVAAYLYLGAILEKWKLEWRHLVAIGVTVVVGALFQYLLQDLSLAFNVISLVVLPAIFKPKLFNLVFAFSIHVGAQYLAVAIRGIGDNIANTNFAALLVILVDHYLWLLLLFLYFAVKKDVFREYKNKSSEGGKANGNSYVSSTEKR